MLYTAVLWSFLSTDSYLVVSLALKRNQQQQLVNWLFIILNVGSAVLGLFTDSRDAHSTPENSVDSVLIPAMKGIF